MPEAEFKIIKHEEGKLTIEVSERFMEIVNEYVNGEGRIPTEGDWKTVPDNIQHFYDRLSGKYDFENKHDLDKMSCPLCGETWIMAINRYKACECQDCGFIAIAKDFYDK